MARRVFFSFHYERDVWRANVVRNSWVTQDRVAAGFWDASLWEEAKRRGDAAIKRMIDDALIGTSVTAVLIGVETYDRDWVKYEIRESYDRGNGLLGIYINNIANQNGITDTTGPNPFNYLYGTKAGVRVSLSTLCPSYYWFGEDGYKNFGGWIEQAALAAGR
jgi:hypothetical protein